MPSAVTFPNRSSHQTRRRDSLGTHSVCQVLGSEDSAQSLFIVYDENTVGPFCCTELTCFCDGNGIWNCEGWAGLKCGHSSFGNVRFASTSPASLLGG